MLVWQPWAKASLANKVMDPIAADVHCMLSPHETLQTMPASLHIVCRHLSQDMQVLYCAALKGQQATAVPAAAGKGKPGKQGDYNHSIE